MDERPTFQTGSSGLRVLVSDRRQAPAIAQIAVDHRAGHFAPGMTVQAHWNPGDALLLDA